jgi:SPP1 family predicted phage head-tail adaptor
MGNPRALAAGSLRHTVTLLQPQSSVDISGQAVTYVSFKTVRAGISSLRGTDQERSGQFVAEEFTLVKIRYIPGVTSDMRVQFGNRMFEVQAIANVLELNRFLNLTCVELDGQK